MDDMASAFSRLSYFNPTTMMVNRSETSAVRRLLQCTDLGVYTNDISAKFEGSGAADLSPEDFAARRNVVRQVTQWSKSMGGRGKPQIVVQNEWTPILYLYEIVKSAAKRERDWGHLVFVDLTISHFLIVMIMPDPCNCGNLDHHDYDSITRWHADRFMGLCAYLHRAYRWGNKPGWVRATYTTPSHGFRLPPDFLASAAPPSSPTVKGELPIFHVTSEDFAPALLESELEKIDTVAINGRGKPASAVIMDAARKRVLGTKADRPDVGGSWMRKNPRQCANCEAISKTDLQICSRCKMVYYCNRECQRSHWRKHRLFCKAPATEAETA